MLRNKFKFLLILTVAAVLSVPAQDKQKDGKKDAARTGTPVLWEAVDVAAFDTLNGPGGESMKPDLTAITFIEEQKGGHSKKYRIKDGAGKTWVAKLGDEAQPETAAVRLLAALGYKTDINYLVPSLTIPGKGTFTNVRLEARPDDIKRGDTWSWTSNPFKGTREFQALKIMMAFVNNWDMKQDNNVILHRGDKLEYAISDLGVSFGKTGNKGLPIFWRIGRSRNVPQEYSEAEFIKNVKEGRINFNFNGKNDGSLGDITREDGRWLADLLIRLTDKQIEDAFRAGNYSEADIATLVESVKVRIRALDLATADASPSAVVRPSKRQN
ncbi:MAG: hypothetical protein WKF34_13725 [Pyrinomonadaceae bacterium]